MTINNFTFNRMKLIFGDFRTGNILVTKIDDTC